MSFDLIAQMWQLLLSFGKHSGDKNAIVMDSHKYNKNVH